MVSTNTFFFLAIFEIVRTTKIIAGVGDHSCFFTFYLLIAKSQSFFILFVYFCKILITIGKLEHKVSPN